MSVGLRKRLKSFLKDPLQFKSEPAQCPLCGFHGRFLTYGTPPRRRCMCPACKSGERHRLLWFCFEDKGLWQAGDVLHFAPEKKIEELLRKSARSYLSADIRPGIADRVEDVQALSLGDAQFDLVIANHIFEHIENDEAAFREIHRVTRPGGRAVLSVPMIYSWSNTYENPDVREGADRDRHFGQNDHVRYYGRDFESRFAAAGFSVETYETPPDKAHTYALDRHEVIFIGTKGRAH